MSDTFRDSVRSELQAVLASYTGSWDFISTTNEPEDPDSSQPFVTLEFAGGNETPAWFGDPTHNGWRSFELCYINLVAPNGQYQGELEAHGRVIRNAFRNRRWQTSDGLDCRCLAVNPLGGGQDDRAFWRESIALEIRTFNIG